MPDREKVIKGLERCIADDFCNGCPYEEHCFSDGEMDGEITAERMMRDALALLKEREPVKPIKQKQLNGYMFSYACSKCGTFLLPLGISAQYCYHCGTAVKWDAAD